jgi:hypothetical protein
VTRNKVGVFDVALPVVSFSHDPHFPHIYNFEAQVIKAAGTFSYCVSGRKVSDYTLIGFSEFGEKVK